MTHTKGPWVPYFDERHFGAQIHSQGKCNHWIANLKCESCPGQAEANAHLIAAAPDMLEALNVAKQLAEVASDWNLDEVEIDGKMQSIYDVTSIFRAAISKARGKS